MAYGFVLVPLPQILAAQGVSGGRIAVVIAFVASPSFWNFVLAPLLDIRFRRRTYALIFGVVAVWTIAFTAAHHASLVEVGAVMFLGVVAFFCMGQRLADGWVGSSIRTRTADSVRGRPSVLLSATVSVYWSRVFAREALGRIGRNSGFHCVSYSVAGISGDSMPPATQRTCRKRFRSIRQRGHRPNQTS
jgi:hypothetical protein